MDIYDELSETDDEGEDDIETESTDSDSTQCRYSVENSYNDEKEQACVSLSEICKHMGYDFYLYFTYTYLMLMEVIDKRIFCYDKKKINKNRVLRNILFRLV